MRRPALAAALAAAALTATACGSQSPLPKATGTTSTSVARAPKVSPVDFTADGAPVYGSLGPEGVPLETGVSLGAPNPNITGQTVDGVGCDRTEQLAYHHHVHLIVFVDGVARSLPLGIGIMPKVGVEQTARGAFADSSTSCFYWLHVHAADGIIHIEAPTQQTFTLGQFFAVYGQPLSSNQVAGAGGPVTATVDGRPYPSDPASIPLDQHDQIVLNVGAPVVTPPPIDWSLTQL